MYKFSGKKLGVPLLLLVFPGEAVVMVGSYVQAEEVARTEERRTRDSMIVVVQKRGDRVRVEEEEKGWWSDAGGWLVKNRSAFSLPCCYGVRCCCGL